MKYPIIVTHVHIMPIGNPIGKLRALVRITLNEAFQLTQLRLYEGQNGLFVGYPIDPAQKGEEYRQMFYPLTRELRDEIDRIVIAEYLKVKEAMQ